jgi:hypothetical protein
MSSLKIIIVEDGSPEGARFFFCDKEGTQDTVKQLQKVYGEDCVISNFRNILPLIQEFIVYI